jgi:hypothetical protein
MLMLRANLFRELVGGSGAAWAAGRLSCLFLQREYLLLGCRLMLTVGSSA